MHTKALVKLTVETQPADISTGAGAKAIERDPTVEANEPVADFDTELVGLVFDGPSLPPDFSRADIYADHDSPG